MYVTYKRIGLCLRAEKQDECCGWSDELHAQYRTERGNLSCDHIEREAESFSSYTRVHPSSMQPFKS
jgi:hypothetical protein